MQNICVLPSLFDLIQNSFSTGYIPSSENGRSDASTFQGILKGALNNNNSSESRQTVDSRNSGNSKITTNSRTKESATSERREQANTSSTTQKSTGNPNQNPSSEKSCKTETGTGSKETAGILNDDDKITGQNKTGSTENPSETIQEDVKEVVEDEISEESDSSEVQIEELSIMDFVVLNPECTMTLSGEYIEIDPETATSNEVVNIVAETDSEKIGSAFESGKMINDFIKPAGGAGGEIQNKTKVSDAELLQTLTSTSTQGSSSQDTGIAPALNDVRITGDTHSAAEIKEVEIASDGAPSGNSTTSHIDDTSAIPNEAVMQSQAKEIKPQILPDEEIVEDIDETSGFEHVNPPAQPTAKSPEMNMNLDSEASRNNESVVISRGEQGNRETADFAITESVEKDGGRLATARTETAYKPSPNQTPEFEKAVAAQIIRGTLQTAKSGRNELVLQLRPPELGSVRIRLTLENDTMTGKIVVASENIKGIVERQIPELRSALNEEGVKMERIEVSVQNQHERHTAKNNAGDDEDRNNHGRENPESQLHSEREKQEAFLRRTRNIEMVKAENRRLHIVI